MPNTELTLDIVQSQMRPQQRLTVDKGTVAEIQKLAEDSEGTVVPSFIEI